MYSEHAPQISAEIYDRPEAMRRALIFVVLTIQQKIILVPAMLSDVEEKGLSSDYLWGHKVDAVAWIEDHYNDAWGEARECEDPAEFIWYLMQCPGLGIVKSAFAAQLAGFDVACLDSQNIKRLGLRWDAYRSRGGPNKRSKAARRRVLAYVEQTHGQAETMWNDWCAYVAPKYKMTAHEISALHLAIIEEQT